MGLAAPGMTTKESAGLVGGHPHPEKTKDHHAYIEFFFNEPFDTPKCGVKGFPDRIVVPSIMFPCRSSRRTQPDGLPQGMNEHPIPAPLIQGLVNIQ